MANVKISGLTAATSASGTQEFEINDSGTSKKVTGAQLLAYIQGAITAFVNKTGTNGSAVVPYGTTAQRDASPITGYFRFNTTLSKFEGYNGTAWGSVGGGATGGGTDDIFIENGQTVTTNYTITANKNAVSAGPITINTGITVTVPTGSTWVIV